MRFLLSTLSLLAVSHAACFNGALPAGSQRSAITNVVSAAVVGTNLGRSLAAQTEADYSSLFPLGFAWTNATAFDGLVANSITGPFFNGAILNGSTTYGGPYFTYSPLKTATCNTTRDYDYTNSFLFAIDPSTSPEDASTCSNGDAMLIEHLVTQIGTLESCSEFSADNSTLYTKSYMSPYLVENVFTDIDDTLAITAEYHQRMGITKAVMDTFVSQVVASLEAHGLNSTYYGDLANTIFTNLYAGPYSLISASATACPTNYVFATNNKCNALSSTSVYAKIAMIIEDEMYNCATDLETPIASTLDTFGGKSAIFTGQNCTIEEDAHSALRLAEAGHAHFLYMSNMVFNKVNETQSLADLLTDAAAALSTSLTQQLGVPTFVGIRECTDVTCSVVCRGVCSSASSASSFFALVVALFTLLLA